MTETPSHDRELIELAARSVLIYGDWSDGNEPHSRGPGIEVLVRGDVIGTFAVIWNPLLDDGDEARLESKLGINIQWDPETVYAARFGPTDIVEFERYADHGGDKQAARRRAGVRTAAAIGLAMKTAKAPEPAGA